MHTEMDAVIHFSPNPSILYLSLIPPPSLLSDMWSVCCRDHIGRASWL
ncbi:unnamed protein product [Staurois parvus]|uniref:Uncharacterized protein n=1 Tax=Staurois parvus TaxID=386267 RepID=A0ABN9AY30_9NEOB|nr:unnamed protein product [Staurois parvus]